MTSATNPDPQSSLHVPSDPAVPLSQKPLGFSSTQASVLLDLVRGLAAIVVLAGHWRGLFFVDYPDIAGRKLLWALPYVLTSGGHQAVIVFFVLSGYLISGSVFRMFQRNRWSWRDYLLHRIVRLWVVLIPGLALAALWDTLGLHLQGVARAVYTGGARNYLLGDIRPGYHLWVWFANLFFLQGHRIPTFGTDTALWSLANEFWYYILFPLGLLALRRETRPALRASCGIAFLLIAVLIDRPILILFPVWLLGTLLALLKPPTLGHTARIGATIVYVPVFFFFARQNLVDSWLADSVFGIVTFGFLWILLSAREPSRKQDPVTAASRILARFSYTLYVAHFPPLVLCTALVLGTTRWQPAPLHLAWALLALALALLYAYCLAWLTEFRTDRVRKAIERRLPG